MEFKTDALLLRAVDYGENDKMVTLLTAERGKLGAGLKGVKKAGAKLKFAAQPFCFAEYVLAERGGRYTVTGCSLHDGFFALREDIRAFYAASIVTAACDGLVFEGAESGEMLVAAVSALGEMCGDDPSFALVKFLLKALAVSGYPVAADNCPVCGEQLSGRMAFDMQRGSFCCSGCTDGVPASESTYLTVRAALGKGAAHPKDGEKRALRLLGAYYTWQTDGELGALREYLTL